MVALSLICPDSLQLRGECCWAVQLEPGHSCVNVVLLMDFFFKGYKIEGIAEIFFSISPGNCCDPATSSQSICSSGAWHTQSLQPVQSNILGSVTRGVTGLC